MQRASSDEPPVLSIVTPSFNQAKFLERTINSVLDQDDPHLQYVIIDGGSTDGSVEIIRKYEKHLHFWCSEPDGGQSMAIVKGFTKTAGAIRGWINSDDEYVAGTFRRVRHEFERSPQLGLVYGERILIGPDSEVLGWSRLAPYDPEIAGYTIASETAFWTAAAEQQAGPIDPSLQFAMDVDFFTRLYLTVPSKKLGSYLGRFRCHDDSKSATIPEQGIRETERFWAEHFGSSETWRIPPESQRARHLLAGIRHPRLLAVPYLQQKLSGARG